MICSPPYSLGGQDTRAHLLKVNGIPLSHGVCFSHYCTSTRVTRVRVPVWELLFCLFLPMNEYCSGREALLFFGCEAAAHCGADALSFTVQDMLSLGTTIHASVVADDGHENS